MRDHPLGVNWRKQLRFDPLPPLLSSQSTAMRYFARRDLLGADVEPVDTLWRLPDAQRILNKQLENGAWAYPGGGKERYRATEDYDQIETFRKLGYLVEMYGLNAAHPAMQRAAQFLFSRQTEEEISVVSTATSTRPTTRQQSWSF